jgi:hypothetical protein
MERKLIRGKTTEQKLDSIDKILQSFQRRLGNKVVGIIPPVPILHSTRTVPEDGLVFAAIIPLNGIVTTLCFSLIMAKRKTETFDITLTRPDGSTHTKGVVCRKPVEVFQPGINVSVGDVVRIMAFNPADISDILIGALIHAEITPQSRDAQMLDRLLELEREQNAS